MSAAPPVPSAKQLVLSGDQLAMSVEKPMPEHTSALLAAQEENSTADMDPFLPQQAQRAWHKQQYGVSSVTWVSVPSAIFSMEGILWRPGPPLGDMSSSWVEDHCLFLGVILMAVHQAACGSGGHFLLCYYRLSRKQD